MNHRILGKTMKKAENILKIPSLTNEQIINYCGRKVYEQAVELLSTDLLLCQFKEGQALTAFFAEGLKEKYAVKIKFDFRSIIFSSCSCPNNKLGPCIHIAVVLLSWQFNPKNFTDLSQLSAGLENISKQELLSMLCTVVQYHPDTEDIYDQETACG